MAKATLDVTLHPDFERQLWRRTVAALDATKGISTEDLEAGAVALNLIEASIEIGAILDSEAVYEHLIDALAAFDPD
jgi:hypothetical protein